MYNQEDNINDLLNQFYDDGRIYIKLRNRYNTIYDTYFEDRAKEIGIDMQHYKTQEELLDLLKKSNCNESKKVLPKKYILDIILFKKKLQIFYHHIFSYTST